MAVATLGLDCQQILQLLLSSPTKILPYMNNDQQSNPNERVFESAHYFDELARKGWNRLDSKQATATKQQLAVRFRKEYQLPPRRRSNWTFAVAASVAIVIACSLYFQQRATPQLNLASIDVEFANAPDELLPLALLGVERKQSGQERELLLQTTRKCYEKRDFVSAARLLKTLLVESPQNQDILLLLGHTQLQFAPRLAQTTCEDLLSMNAIDPATAIYAQWFLAWSMYLQGEDAAAVNQLEQLIAQDNWLTPDASALLAFMQEG